ncbi:putative membrane protein [Mycobacterium kansasii]|uniref:Putative membrane protein n=1 Tax=Mycobacterium kansasii TaxID=1768 RepID=A0A1V3WE77_MYCKA|nr:putative membrane protein [Mycobacterium kansasii]
MRWLIGAAVTAATLAAIASLLYPRFFTTTGALWGSLAIAGFSTIISASMLYAQAPIHQRLAAPLTGLDNEQRTETSNALRRGEIPADSRALTAAITMGTLALTSRRRQLRGATKFVWVVPVLFTVSAFLAFASNDIRHGVFSIGFALYFATYYTWLGYRQRRLTQHVESLRAAARNRGIPIQIEDSVSVPTRRMWALATLLIVVGLTTGAMAYLADRPDPDCRAANAAIDLNYHADLARWTEATSAGDLARYQAWSDQLHSYAQQAPNGAIRDHLRRMADLSARAVSLLQDIASNEASSAAADVITKQKIAYLNTITQMLDEQKGLPAICYSHS